MKKQTKKVVANKKPTKKGVDAVITKLTGTAKKTVKSAKAKAASAKKAVKANKKTVAGTAAGFGLGFVTGKKVSTKKKKAATPKKKTTTKK